MLNIENLKQFVQIVEIGSVQGAARRLGVSRSVVRRALDELEAAVGAPLLHRDPAGVRLTAAGAVLLDGARPLLESTRSLITDARAAEQEARGVIRVIEPVGLPAEMHVRVITAAHALLPNQRIVIRHVENPLTELNHPFELMLHEGGPPDRNHWFSRVVVRVRLRLVASQGYLARRGVPTRVADLTEHDTLGWNRPGHPGGEWPLLAGGSITVSPWFASSDPQLLATLAAREGGIFLSPNIPFFEGPETEPLVPVLEDQVGGDMVFRATTPFPTQADPRTRDTVAMIAAHLESLAED